MKEGGKFSAAIDRRVAPLLTAASVAAQAAAARRAGGPALKRTAAEDAFGLDAEQLKWRHNRRIQLRVRKKEAQRRFFQRTFACAVARGLPRGEAAAEALKALAAAVAKKNSSGRT